MSLKTKFQNLKRYDYRDDFNLPNHRVESYFDRVAEGQSEDYRTPFWNSAPRDSVLDDWYKILSKHAMTKAVPGLLKYELEMLEKVGPLSVMKPLVERLPDIQNYYDAVKVKSIPIDSRAVASFLSKLRSIGKIRPYDVKETLNHMRLSTNSGAPWFMKRRKVVDEHRDLLTLDYPAVIGWRGQEGGPDVEDVKQRVVWMFPLNVNIAELMMYTPLIKAWQAHNINSAYISIAAVEEKLTKLFDTKGDNYVVVTDFTKFDQHFNKDMQNAARAALEFMIDYDYWLENVFPIKYNIPMAISRDYQFVGEHGMGSGSGGTNFDECCAHSMLQEEVALQHDTHLNPYSNAYGDDGYLSYDGIDVDDVIDAYVSHGQEMNPDKQSVSKDSAIYLRRYFHSNYRDRSGKMLGIYSTCRAIGRLMGQERYYDSSKQKEVDYAKYLTLRAWSILENCNAHPAFDELVKFVIKGDIYKLGLGIPGFMESFEKDFDKLREMDPDVLGYTKTLQTGQTSVRDWRIFKTLKRFS